MLKMVREIFGQVRKKYENVWTIFHIFGGNAVVTYYIYETSLTVFHSI